MNVCSMLQNLTATHCFLLILPCTLNILPVDYDIWIKNSIYLQSSHQKLQHIINTKKAWHDTSTTHNTKGCKKIVSTSTINPFCKQSLSKPFNEWLIHCLRLRRSCIVLMNQGAVPLQVQYLHIVETVEARKLRNNAADLIHVQ